jgi:hypothetical protein
MSDHLTPKRETLPPVFEPDTQEVRLATDRLVVTAALSRPLVVSTLLSESPSGVDSYEDALAAVFAQADRGEGGSRLQGPALTPDAVVAFLSALPGHLARDSRFRWMEEELRRYPGSDPNTLVGDAASQLVLLRTELEQHTSVQESATLGLRQRIEQLEEELSRLRQQLGDDAALAQERRQELLVKIDEMTGVIVFFDSYQSFLIQRDQPVAEATPTFLDEELALRLLEQNTPGT